MLATILSFQPTLAVVFSTLLAAMILGFLGRPRPASLCILACLLLAVWQFLFEIYDPKEGFRMPWLQAELQIQPGREA
jgi:hypothetical protein